MDTDSFMIYTKTNDIQIDHCLKEKNRKIIGQMKYDLGRKIMTKFVGLRANLWLLD